jgi:hypothetical protein
MTRFEKIAGARPEHPIAFGAAVARLGPVSIIGPAEIGVAAVSFEIDAASVGAEPLALPVGVVDMSLPAPSESLGFAEGYAVGYETPHAPDATDYRTARTLAEGQREPGFVGNYIKGVIAGSAERHPTPRRVILKSPYGSPDPALVERNVAYARAAMRDSLLRGEAPIASHLLYTQPGVLDDQVPDERARGIEAGLAWGEVAEATVAYVDLGITSGMRKGIDRARAEGRLVEFRNLSGWGVKT